MINEMPRTEFIKIFARFKNDTSNKAISGGKTDKAHTIAYMV